MTGVAPLLWGDASRLIERSDRYDTVKTAVFG